MSEVGQVSSMLSSAPLVSLRTGAAGLHAHAEPRPVARTASAANRIVLVSMPFGPLFTPSIALGLLASELQKADFQTEILYLTVSFARKVGIKLYERISAGAPETSLLFGDWLFRDAAFGRAKPADEEVYLELLDEAFCKRTFSGTGWSSMEDLRSDLVHVRSVIDCFLDEAVDQILDLNPILVGFTTVFQQNVASLALSSRLKQRTSTTRIVFGGANCEGQMGEQLIRSFSQIDYVVSGEGEEALVRLARCLAAAPLQKGELDVQRIEPAVLTGASAVNLDGLAYPEYGSYFAQVGDTPEIRSRARLLFETSRGCWWGQRKHCTFCGLNGTSMAFRSKSADRAFRELVWLTSTYPEYPVSVVDNILDMKYFDTFIPRLQNSPLQTELFYEVKANLKKSQLQQLRSVNIRRIQPGIESLHDGVLMLMRKGVSAIQNIQLLKWCLWLDVEPLWNILWGFPGEDPDWYVEMASLIPKLHHLRPPDSVSEIRLDRFSPLFDDAALGALNKRPFPAYDCVYAELSSEERSSLAYHFTFEYADSRDVSSYTRELRQAIVQWQTAFEQSAFFRIPVDGQSVLCDMRGPSDVQLSLLDHVDTKLYIACDAAHTIESAHAALEDASITREICAERLQSLEASGAMLQIRGKYLSLAVEMNEHVPGPRTLERFQSFIQNNNHSLDDSVARVHLKPQSTR